MNRGKAEGVRWLVVLPEKKIPSCRRGETHPVALGQLSRRDWGLLPSLPSLPPVQKISGVQCRFLSSKHLLAPRLCRWPAGAPGMGARSNRDVSGGQQEGKGEKVPCTTTGLLPAAVGSLPTRSAVFSPFATVLSFTSTKG